MIGDLTMDQERDEGLILAGMMRFWEQDEQEKMRHEQEHERSLGSSHIEVEGGAG
jgi:hypothetical protein